MGGKYRSYKAKICYCPNLKFLLATLKFWFYQYFEAF